MLNEMGINLLHILNIPNNKNLMYLGEKSTIFALMQFLPLVKNLEILALSETSFTKIMLRFIIVQSATLTLTSLGSVVKLLLALFEK